jgi:hypothetical protein
LDELAAELPIGGVELGLHLLGESAEDVLRGVAVERVVELALEAGQRGEFLVMTLPQWSDALFEFDLFNQSTGERIDQSIQAATKTLDLALQVSQTRVGLSLFLLSAGDLGAQSRWVAQQVAKLRPSQFFERFSVDGSVAANWPALPAVLVASNTAIVEILASVMAPTAISRSADSAQHHAGQEMAATPLTFALSFLVFVHLSRDPIEQVSINDCGHRNDDLFMRFGGLRNLGSTWDLGITAFRSFPLFSRD